MLLSVLLTRQEEEGRGTDGVMGRRMDRGTEEVDTLLVSPSVIKSSGDNQCSEYDMSCNSVG